MEMSNNVVSGYRTLRLANGHVEVRARSWNNRNNKRNMNSNPLRWLYSG